MDLLAYTLYFSSIFADEIIFYDVDKYHGVILLPEGLIESIPEVFALLKVNNGF